MLSLLVPFALSSVSIIVGTALSKDSPYINKCALPSLTRIYSLLSVFAPVAHMWLRKQIHWVGSVQSIQFFRWILFGEVKTVLACLVVAVRAAVSLWSAPY